VSGPLTDEVADFELCHLRAHCSDLADELRKGVRVK
jgi:hypothetical protein